MAQVMKPLSQHPPFEKAGPHTNRVKKAAQLEPGAKVLSGDYCVTIWQKVDGRWGSLE